MNIFDKDLEYRDLIREDVIRELDDIGDYVSELHRDLVRYLRKGSDLVEMCRYLYYRMYDACFDEREISVDEMRNIERELMDLQIL